MHAAGRLCYRISCTTPWHALLHCRQEPPAAKSQQELEQWMCSVHNSVNESLGKPAFNCRVAGLRWPAVDCGGADVCSLGAPGHGKT